MGGLLGGSDLWGLLPRGSDPGVPASHWGGVCIPACNGADPPVNRITDTCKTRMRSSRMHTSRLLTICWSLLPGGGVCSWGGVCSGGVSAQGGACSQGVSALGMSAPRGVYPSMH